MKKNKRLLFGVISIVLAAVIALIGIPAVISRTNTAVQILRVKAEIAKGTVVSAEQIETVEVSSHGLPADVAAEPSQVIGRYALVDLVPGDYFLPAKVSSTPPEKDGVLSSLPEGKTAVSLSVRTLAGVLANKLRKGDIVSLYRYENGEILLAEELRYVKIIAVTNQNGTNIEDAVGDESRMATAVTFLADPLQAERMIEIENKAPLHMVLVSRGDEERAEELLAEQEEILEELRQEREEAEEEEEP